MRKLLVLTVFCPLLAFGQNNTIQVIVHNTSGCPIWADGIQQGGTFWNMGTTSGWEVAPGTTFTSGVQSGWIPYTDVLHWNKATSAGFQDSVDQQTSVVVTAEPGIAEYWISGGCGSQTGGGAPMPTNSQYCITINNNSGVPQFDGIADVDTGQAASLDSCGGTLVYVAPGATVTICTTAPVGANMAAFTATGNVLGINNACGSLTDPNPNGDIAPTNIIGTPIPIGGGGSGSSGNTNTNYVYLPPGNYGQNTNEYNETNGPINFGGTGGTGAASNPVLVQGFNGEAAALGAISAELGAIQLKLNDLFLQSTGSSDLATVIANTTDIPLMYNLDQIRNTGLGTISNEIASGDVTLIGISNEFAALASNSFLDAAALNEISNYADKSLSFTNAALGGLSAVWSDGDNRNNLTNMASAVVGTGALTTMQTTGGDALATMESIGLGPASDATGGADANFWTLSESVGGKTYAFDLNPMDNAGIAEIAGICRNFEQWVLCFAFVCLVMNLFDKYFAAMAQTAQTQANRTEVLGNSVGQLSGAVYLPVMVACMLAIPLFISAALASSGASWFASVSSPPLSLSGHSHPIEQAIWLADQFIPLNFVVASALWYLFIRLTAAPVWATSVVILKTLIS